MPYCGTVIRKRNEELVDSFRKGFLLEAIIMDLRYLSNKGLHNLSEDKIKPLYQETIDLIIENNLNDLSLLRSFVDLRDGKLDLPKQVLNYLIDQVSSLDIKYLNRTSKILHVYPYD